MKFPEAYRVRFGGRYSSVAGDAFGAFVVPAHKAPGRRELHIIACDGIDAGWEHVSVSINNAPKQCATWVEMCFVKSLFWDESECVVQFHPAKKDRVNFHEGCLHLWRYTKGEFPMPPIICV